MKARFVRLLLMLIGTSCVAIGGALFALLPAQPVDAGASSKIDPFTDFACLDCHTDQQRLIELIPIEEEPEAESLSSGPG